MSLSTLTTHYKECFMEDNLETHKKTTKPMKHYVYWIPEGQRWVRCCMQLCADVRSQSR